MQAEETSVNKDQSKKGLDRSLNFENVCRRKFDAHRMLSDSVFVDYMLKVGNLVLKTKLKT